MKTSSLKFYCFFLFGVIAIVGCSPGSDDPLNGDCVLTRVSYPGDTTALSTRYYYDDQGKLIQITYNNHQINFSYTGNKVIRNEAGHMVEYTIGPDSVTVSSANIPSSPGEQVYSQLYYYNAEKYLIKTVGYLDGVLWDSTERKVENGNVVQTTWYQHGAAVDIVNDYSFHMDMPAKSWTYTMLAGEYGYFYSPWLGRPNNNLMKLQSQGVFKMGEYKFALDVSGYIQSITYTSHDSNPPFTENWAVEHACK